VSSQTNSSRDTFLRLIKRSEELVESGFSSVYIRGMKNEEARRLRFFRYLRRLRAGGRTNMYGAVPYLMKAFNLDRASAFAVVCDWLDQQNDPMEVEPETPTRRRRLSSASQ